MERSQQNLERRAGRPSPGSTLTLRLLICKAEKTLTLRAAVPSEGRSLPGRGRDTHSLSPEDPRLAPGPTLERKGGTKGKSWGPAATLTRAILCFFSPSPGLDPNVSSFILNKYFWSTNFVMRMVLKRNKSKTKVSSVSLPGAQNLLVEQTDLSTITKQCV